MREIHNKTQDYLKAIQLGFEHYGTEGENNFYAMHQDVCANPQNPWGYALEILNDLPYEEFEKWCLIYQRQVAEKAAE